MQRIVGERARAVQYFARVFCAYLESLTTSGYVPCPTEPSCIKIEIEKPSYVSLYTAERSVVQDQPEKYTTHHTPQLPEECNASLAK